MPSLRLMYESPVGALLTGWRRRRRRGVTPASEDSSLEEDPFRADYVRAIPRAQLYRGVLLHGYLISEDLLESLDDLHIREDDLFIVTYPKSGTTWTEELVSLIYEGGDVDRVSREPLVYRVHHLEVGRPLGHLRFLRGLRSPRLLASHLPLPLLPRRLFGPQGGPVCKVIYVVRNPKDNAVSYYHHHRMSTFLGNYGGSWDEFLAHYLAGHLVYGSWFDHAQPYWEFHKQHPDRVFFLSYEQLKRDLGHMVRCLCAFLGRSLEEGRVEAIAAHCSFDSMKSNAMVNREVLPIADLFDMSRTKFMRKGIVGDWKNYFSPEQSAAFDDVFRTRMSGSDLRVCFEPDEALALPPEPPPWLPAPPPPSPPFGAALLSPPPLLVHLQPDPLLALDAAL